MHHSEQKCAHFYCAWYIVGYETGALWDLWDWSITVALWFQLSAICIVVGPLQLRHNGRDGVSNHQPRDCLLNLSFRRRSNNTPKLRVTDLCTGNSPVTGEFPAQMASNAENVSIWWRHHVDSLLSLPRNPGVIKIGLGLESITMADK